MSTEKNLVQTERHEKKECSLAEKEKNGNDKPTEEKEWKKKNGSEN